jgi:RNA polymerase sigma-70 factor (ECF subfamily)
VSRCVSEEEAATFASLSAGARPAAPETTGDEAAFVEALKRRDRSAEVRFYDRYTDLVSRIMARVVGVDDDLPDLIHEAFMRALKGISGLRDAEAITTWMTQVATRTAVDALRRRQTRRKWFSLQPSPKPEVVTPEEPEGTLDAQAALRSTYQILGCLPPEERAAFALRRLEGRELNDVASACRCSLATIKRRLERAEKAFFALAAQNPALREWLSGSRRASSGLPLEAHRGGSGTL